ncbi:Conserved_hypothetical protein [Hexamita inflata]|uniref:RING-type domain-containing protein n=1 Tax=Hexamita inflata TaxID=28002 RepID=A0AA86R653_9EUKA|nr:Conserved hypothetical protein [Hexamita inflata]CAI9925623.1 Conserved hypothetical protein [Hexamita inflata]CAI9966767.1 Conserved hypothetical protein [Hexamita inflata]
MNIVQVLNEDGQQFIISGSTDISQMNVMCSKCNNFFVYLRKFGCSHTFCPNCCSELDMFCTKCNSVLIHSTYVSGDYERLIKKFQVKLQINQTVFNSYKEYIDYVSISMFEPVDLAQEQKDNFLQKHNLTQSVLENLDKHLTTLTSSKDSQKFHKNLINFVLKHEQQNFTLKSVQTIPSFDYSLISTHFFYLLAKCKPELLIIDNNTLILNSNSLLTAPSSIKSLQLLTYNTQDPFILHEINKFFPNVTQLTVDTKKNRKSLPIILKNHLNTTSNSKKLNNELYFALSSSAQTVLKQYNQNVIKTYQPKPRKLSPDEMMRQALINSAPSFYLSYYLLLEQNGELIKNECKIIDVSKFNINDYFKIVSISDNIDTILFNCIPIAHNLKISELTLSTACSARKTNLTKTSLKELEITLKPRTMRLLHLFVQKCTSLQKINFGNQDLCVLVPSADSQLFQECLKFIITCKLERKIQLSVNTDLFLPDNCYECSIKTFNYQNLNQISEQDNEMVTYEHCHQVITQHSKQAPEQITKQIINKKLMERVFIKQALSTQVLPPRTSIHLLTMLAQRDPDFAAHHYLSLIDSDFNNFTQFKEYYLQYKLEALSPEIDQKPFKRFDAAIPNLMSYSIFCDYFHQKINYTNLKQNQSELFCLFPSTADFKLLHKFNSEFKEANLILLEFPCRTAYFKNAFPSLINFIFSAIEMRNLLTDSPFLRLAHAVHWQGIENQYLSQFFESTDSSLFTEFLIIWRQRYNYELFEYPLPCGVIGSVREGSSYYFLNDCTQSLSSQIYENDSNGELTTYAKAQQLFEQFKKQFTNLVRVCIYNANLLLVRPLVFAPLLNTILTTCSELQTDSRDLQLFLTNLMDGYIYVSANSMAMIQIAKLFAEQYYISKQNVSNLSIQSISQNQSQENMQIGSRFKAGRKTRKPASVTVTNLVKELSTIVVFDARDQLLGSCGEPFFNNFLELLDQLLKESQAKKIRFPKLLFQKVEFERVKALMDVLIDNDVGVVTGSVVNDAQCQFIGSIVGCVIMKQQKILNIGFLNYQLTFDLIAYYKEKLIAQVTTLVFEQLGQPDCLCDHNLTEIFGDFQLVENVTIAENHLDISHKDEIEQFLLQFKNLQQYCIGEHFEIDLEGIKEIEPKLEFVNGAVVKVYAFEGGETVDAEKMWETV